MVLQTLKKYSFTIASGITALASTVAGALMVLDIGKHPYLTHVMPSMGAGYITIGLFFVAIAGANYNYIRESERDEDGSGSYEPYENAEESPRQE